MPLSRVCVEIPDPKKEEFKYYINIMYVGMQVGMSVLT